jgi:hypothetical protein
MSEGTDEGASEGTSDGAPEIPVAEAASSAALAPLRDAVSAAALLLFCVTTMGTATTRIKPTRTAMIREMVFAANAIVALLFLESACAFQNGEGRCVVECSRRTASWKNCEKVDIKSLARSLAIAHVSGLHR